MAMTEQEIRERARELLRELGAARAARALGVGREVLLSLAADSRVTQGTLALTERNLTRRFIAGAA